MFDTMDAINQSQTGHIDTCDLPDMNRQKPRKYPKQDQDKATAAASTPFGGHQNGEELLDQTEFESRLLKECMAEMVQKCKEKSQKPNYYIILRNSLLKLYWVDILLLSICTFVSESFAVYYNYMISDLITFIKSDEELTSENIWKGIRLIVTFLAFMAAA